MMNAPAKMKIIGIGFGKTGTSTLAACLRRFGYRHLTWDKHLYDAWADGNLQVVWQALQQYDSFDDWPWPMLYREVDARYPGSKFILTTRADVDIWLKSLRTHADRRAGRTRVWQSFGMRPGEFDAAKARQRYLQHIDEVRAYFRDRPGDLLEICWERGDGWQQLAAFLGLPAPDEPLPHAYKTPNDWLYRLGRLQKKMLPLFLRRLLARLQRPAAGD